MWMCLSVYPKTLPEARGFLFSPLMLGFASYTIKPKPIPGLNDTDDICKNAMSVIIRNKNTITDIACIQCQQACSYEVQDSFNSFIGIYMAAYTYCGQRSLKV